MYIGTEVLLLLLLLLDYYYYYILPRSNSMPSIKTNWVTPVVNSTFLYLFLILLFYSLQWH